MPRLSIALCPVSLLLAFPFKSAVDVLDAEDIQRVVFDPCRSVPSEGDFLSVMQHNVTTIETVFRFIPPKN